MSRRPGRRLVAGLATALVIAPALAAVPPATAARSPESPEPRARTHVVAFRMKGCGGCRVQVSHAEPGQDEPWRSRVERVYDREVRIIVPRGYADLLTATVRAPWEGATGYVTQVVFRYAGEQPGAKISVAEARRHRRGTLCLVGDPDDPAVTVHLTVRKVRVRGTTGPTDGTLAFATATQAAADPVSLLRRGVGSADGVPTCRPASAPTA